MSNRPCPGCNNPVAPVHPNSSVGQCHECYLTEMEYLDQTGFGYTPGEDRCPTADRILDNEAFLPTSEVRRLLAAHGHCR